MNKTVKQLTENYTLAQLQDKEQTNDVSKAIEAKKKLIFNAPYFVTMTDKFMSGWGLAKGKTNKLIIACDSFQDAQKIERNAKKRNEMKYVNICSRKPQIKNHHYPSWKHFQDMGEIWKN